MYTALLLLGAENLEYVGLAVAQPPRELELQGARPSALEPAVGALDGSVGRGLLGRVVPGRRRVVVLQHGLLRGSSALGRIARTLRAHGSEVHNLDYPSTWGTIDEHAARLAAPVAALQSGEPLAEPAFGGPHRGRPVCGSTMWE